MSIDRWMDKEVVVHIHNRILLSHKKECLWVSSSEVDEPRTYYTEWSKSEREREILYSNTYMQNLEKWSWRIYLQGSDGETAIENRLMDTGRGEERVRCVERETWKLTLPYVKQVAKRNLLYGSGNSNRGSVSTKGVGWGGRWDRVSKMRGYMYTHGWFMLRFDRKQQNFVKQLSFS